MQYIYTLTKANTLDYFEVYNGGKIEDNQTLIKPADGLFNPTFNPQTEQWEDGEEIEVEPPKPKTEEELLQEQIEETKRKTVTEFELRKLLAEQQRNNMKMMMMMLKK